MTGAVLNGRAFAGTAVTIGASLINIPTNSTPGSGTCCNGTNVVTHYVVLETPLVVEIQNAVHMDVVAITHVV